MFDKFDYFNRGYIFGVKTDKYKPYINYDWSTTTASGLRYLKDVGSTPTYNASMYFGRGAYLNGVDQTITVPINATIQTALKRVNGIVTINETSQALTNYVISGLGVHKDYYLFTRLLTTAEKDSYTNTPELFYAMAQADSTCVLNMPMCETSSTVRNYKTGIDYPTTNYTSSVRDNAKNLRYGLQTCKFVRNSLGVIQSASDYLECDGVGYGNTGWKPSVSEDWTIELIQNDKSTSLQTIGTGTSTPNVFIGRNGSYISSKIGNIDMTAITNLLINHIVVTFNAESKLTNFYVNNQLSSGGNIVTNTSWVNSFSLGVNTQKTFPSSAIFRTFKVHNKVLTQEEITKNYNSYVAAGLLDV